MFDFFKRRAPAFSVGVDDFEVLLAERAGRWYSACLRITKSPSLAEDALQEALIKAWSARTQFAGRAALDTWVHTIAVRCARDQLRARKLLSTDCSDDDLPETASDTRENLPEQALHSQQLELQLSRAMTRLTTQERVCFELKHREEWSLDEISTVLELSLNATKQALFRAVRKLRTALPHWQGVTE